jgi:hypothetical protein
MIFSLSLQQNGRHLLSSIFLRAERNIGVVAYSLIDVTICLFDRFILVQNMSGWRNKKKEPNEGKTLTAAEDV